MIEILRRERVSPEFVWTREKETYLDGTSEIREYVQRLDEIDFTASPKKEEKDGRRNS